MDVRALRTIPGYGLACSMSLPRCSVWRLWDRVLPLLAALRFVGGAKGNGLDGALTRA